MWALYFPEIDIPRPLKCTLSTRVSAIYRTCIRRGVRTSIYTHPRGLSCRLYPQTTVERSSMRGIMARKPTSAPCKSYMGGRMPSLFQQARRRFFPPRCFIVEATHFRLRIACLPYNVSRPACANVHADMIRFSPRLYPRGWCGPNISG